MEGEDLMEDGLCGNCGSQVEGLGLLACGWKLDAGRWKLEDSSENNANNMRLDEPIMIGLHHGLHGASALGVECPLPPLPRPRPLIWV